MKEKELSLCNYDLNNFGNSYDSALRYFDSIIENRKEIYKLDILMKNFADSLNESQKTKVSFLVNSIFDEPNIHSQLEKLKEISLVIKPELKKTYPLYNKNQKTFLNKK